MCSTAEPIAREAIDYRGTGSGCQHARPASPIAAPANRRRSTASCHGSRRRGRLISSCGGTPSAFARSRVKASFAAPSTGAARTLTSSDPSRPTPTISSAPRAVSGAPRCGRARSLQRTSTSASGRRARAAGPAARGRSCRSRAGRAGSVPAAARSCSNRNCADRALEARVDPADQDASDHEQPQHS